VMKALSLYRDEARASLRRPDLRRG